MSTEIKSDNDDDLKELDKKIAALAAKKRNILERHDTEKEADKFDKLDVEGRVKYLIEKTGVSFASGEDATRIKITAQGENTVITIDSTGNNDAERAFRTIRQLAQGGIVDMDARAGSISRTGRSEGRYDRDKLNIDDSHGGYVYDAYTYSVPTQHYSITVDTEKLTKALQAQRPQAKKEGGRF